MKNMFTRKMLCCSVRGRLNKPLHALAILSLALVCNQCSAQSTTALTISVAASLTDAIQEIEAAYRQEHPHVEIKNNFGSSGTLAREIEHGAPVDVFFSAAFRPMDELQAQGLILAGTRHDLLRNTLVLIAPAGTHLAGFPQLLDRSVRFVALGDPNSVPAGQYGQQTLASMHLLDPLRSKLVFAKDVRAVLAYVETGNADVGLVFATDAASSSKVRVIATAPDAAHDPIVYPAAVIAHGKNQTAARMFVDYLSSAKAKAIFKKRGFLVMAQ